ncbi:hypothetical protein GUITHDRAFT_147907 [Guillardia theta CCMP2712]|uniref:Uncharacterized protein n=1 Tax=Guillardia theta (strain CCMP2712) TaxID=905079 RepID=L1IC07_GUITC|nr:hypothetical protein GUITHDRAFT_147907 [Guillardia theta CCMP2712]EKX33459.1 hypothetical protein GUITHDRAFT_147907 [Guillardia theta CCMP2712]|eukprot:XP_005820439.1 hypothetical protein GUITHDRAFT_147907 [Guillardia theta CCMP2712]
MGGGGEEEDEEEDEDEDEEEARAAGDVDWKSEMSQKAVMLALVVLTYVVESSCFSHAPFLSSSSLAAVKSCRPLVLRSRNTLRMQTNQPEEETKEDPYAVKPQVPSFARTENQWAKDLEVGEEDGDKNKKLLAITTGAVALVLSVLYLVAVALLESRGPLQPPPPEALQGALPQSASLVLALLQ